MIACVHLKMPWMVSYATADDGIYASKDLPTMEAGFDMLAVTPDFHDAGVRLLMMEAAESCLAQVAEKKLKGHPSYQKEILRIVARERREGNYFYAAHGYTCVGGRKKADASSAEDKYEKQLRCLFYKDIPLRHGKPSDRLASLERRQKIVSAPVAALTGLVAGGGVMLIGSLCIRKEAREAPLLAA
eukprot:gnl/TRDRNA2_/TRDRNA2_149553_c0_seq1.p1 gnl/TRDRNA2_/TRDRNA2_149553_c0~~gnl/TRDRNA2_/TRDRNA2_149553_c0_seq1.p1  ORF type:complete len:196 (+),score=40.81 gnl/TRDRNA2_/TRDRNA2_149553_c0_seq1:29-589(+)